MPSAPGLRQRRGHAPVERGARPGCRRAPAGAARRSARRAAAPAPGSRRSPDAPDCRRARRDGRSAPGKPVRTRRDSGFNRRVGHARHRVLLVHDQRHAAQPRRDPARGRRHTRPMLSAARGRTRRTTRRAASTARSMRHGIASSASRPLPRTPLTSTWSSGMPVGGTSVPSRPWVEPSQLTGDAARLQGARDREAREDVPAGPAGEDQHRAVAAAHGAGSSGCGGFQRHLGFAPRELVARAQDQADRGAGHQQAGAAGAHQRQGQALGRQHAQVHADRDERLHADPQADAEAQ